MSRKKYIPERDYRQRGYKPFRSGVEDLCGHCKAYYKNLFDQGITSSPFPPKCNGHITTPAKSLKPEDFSSEEEYFDVITDMDPIAWAKKEFDWEARWYQVETLSCTSRYKIIRQGRRTGKTEGAVIGILHKVFTNRDYPVLVLAPFEAQVDMIFQIIDKFISKSDRLSQSLIRNVKRPQLRAFSNGSVIKGFCAGSASSNKSDKIRGQDAKLIYVDEFEYVPESDIDAILPIMISHPEVEMWVTSTPTGEHKKFYSLAVDKDLSFKEFWYTAMEVPHWNEDMEKQLRMQTNAVKFDSPAWVSEVLADFGVQKDGVFLNHYIDLSLEQYSINEERYPAPGARYVLGVDWNDTAGTHMLIVECGKDYFKPVQKIIIEKTEYTQTKSVEAILRLHRKWQFKGIYVDAGYGHVQIEQLKKAGLKERSLNMDKVLQAFTMQQMISIRDPIDGTEVRKHTKPFLVNTLANCLAEGRLILPADEDTVESRSSSNMGLVQQMRNFTIEGYSVHGLPKYSQGYDHTLTAFMLAVGGYILNYSDLGRIKYDTHVAAYSIDLGEDELKSSIIRQVIEDQISSATSPAIVTTSNPRTFKRALNFRGGRRDPGPLGGFSRKNF